MKKIIIVISLIATTILLTGCEESIQSTYSDKYGDTWLSDYLATDTE